MDAQLEGQLENLEGSKKEVKSEKAVPDYPIIKVQLPKEAAIKIQTALQTLKERKADTKADELLAEFLNSVTDDYLEGQIEKRTPEDYYFEAARNIPELREKIVKEAKKALQRTDRPMMSSIASEPKKLRKKKGEDIQVEISAPEITQ